MKSNTELAQKGYVILALDNSLIIEKIAELIRSTLGDQTNFHCSLARTEWHQHVFATQELINRKGLLMELIDMLDQRISRLVGDDLAWVNVLKLRAVRPQSLVTGHDHVPYHRETLYAVTPHQVKHQYNIWMPCSQSATSSGLLYFPNSHIIPDSELDISVNPAHPCSVERYSAGHAIGFPYSTKVIANLPKCSPERIEVPLGSILVFSAMLLHGNGINNTTETRFSVDTGVLPVSEIIENDPLHAAGGKPHYLLPNA